IEAMRDRLEAGILALAPDARLFAKDAERLAGTSCFAMTGVSNETQVMAFDLAGIAVSAGAACSSGKVGASHVLKAMGVPDIEAASAIRVSFGWRNVESDVDAFLAAWKDLWIRTRKSAA
ncbi:MAG TPA: aminotransferase class V-fold PLP-dependent enzyme, partial [Alphaproteobacteria bacterium]|nr:aminotransferase class V-fold PLP-dependent enzyme [Alphaproteobacteria bacterium]